MKKTFLSTLSLLTATCLLAAGPASKDIRSACNPNNTISELSGNPDRNLWLNVTKLIAEPVLTNLAKGELKKNMPCRSLDEDTDPRYSVTHLEAFGRLMTGISPWLELGPDDTPEGKLRKRYIELTIKSIKNSVDPTSPDHMNFSDGKQPLVDAAFLAHGLLRSRTQIWDRLDKLTRQRLLNELKSSRVIKPNESNWLLFSAMVECAIKEFGGEWEWERIQYALDRHEEWYKGDGWYGDGKDFHFDYYNSFVIQPMMTQVLDIAVRYKPELEEFRRIQTIRYSRFAEHLERLISPEGAYPAVGRSLAYRFGAFYALSDVAYRHALPNNISPAQVRSGLTAVIRRQISVPGTFDSHGWLTIGFCGDQPSIGETYISTGSLYLCSAVMIALGLEPSDPFWSSDPEPWTGKKAWEGTDIQKDSYLQ